MVSSEKASDIWIKSVKLGDTNLHSRYGKLDEIDLLVRIWRALKAMGNLDTYVTDMFYDSKGATINIDVYPGWDDFPQRIGELAAKMSGATVCMTVRNGSHHSSTRSRFLEFSPSENE